MGINVLKTFSETRKTLWVSQTRMVIRNNNLLHYNIKTGFLYYFQFMYMNMGISDDNWP